MEEQHSHLPDLGLTMVAMSNQDPDRAVRLATKYPSISRNDAYALALATSRERQLLTGDRDLTKAAKREQVRSNGTL